MTKEMKEILDELNQIESRKSEIAAEVETAEADVLEERDKESKELEARKAELVARKAEIEAEESAAEEVANETEEAEDVELPKEEEKRTMEMEKVYGINSEEYRSAWAKRLMRKELTEVEQRAYASNTTNAVPEAVANKFFEKIKKLAPMLSEITLMQVAGNIKFVAEGTRADATVHTENTAVAPAADTTVSVSLGGKEFMKVIRISKAAETMSVNAFEDWIVDMLSGDIARAIDKFIITNGSTGIVDLVSTSTATNKVIQAATSGYGYTDIVNLVALLPAGYDAEAKFLVSKKVLYNNIKGILDSNKRPIFDPVEKTLFGYPVIVDDYVPSDHKQVFLGKWTDVVGNLSQPVVVDRSEESGFLNNSIDFRGTAIFDSALAKTDAIVWLADA